MREHYYFIMFCRKIQQISQSFPRPKARKKRPPIGGRCALASCKGIKSRRSGKGPDGGGKGVFCGHAAAKRAMVTPPPKRATSLCKPSLRQRPEHGVRLFTFGRIAAPRNVCGTAAEVSPLRKPRARQDLQRISSPQGNSTAGKNLRYSVLRDISRLCFITKSIIGAEPLHLQRVREVRKIGNLPY